MYCKALVAYEKRLKKSAVVIIYVSIGLNWHFCDTNLQCVYIMFV